MDCSGHFHCTDTPDGGPTDQLCLRPVSAQGSCASCPGHRPFCARTLTWVPGAVGSHSKESAAMHRGGPPLPARARAAPRPRSPAQLTSFCPAPSKHLGKPANCSPGREAQRGRAPGPACAQGSPVRCGCARCRQARPAAVVRAHTHTSTRAQRCLRSAHTQLAQLPYPPAPPPPRLPFQHSFGQLKIVNCPTPQTSALFSGPHGLSGSLGTS
jgi:hypothetical protein